MHSKAIFEREQHQCHYFIQDHLTFSNHVHDVFFLCSHRKYQNRYQVLYHSSEVKNSKQPKLKIFQSITPRLSPIYTSTLDIRRSLYVVSCASVFIYSSASSASMCSTHAVHVRYATGYVVGYGIGSTQKYKLGFKLFFSVFFVFSRKKHLHLN